MDDDTALAERARRVGPHDGGLLGGLTQHYLGAQLVRVKPGSIPRVTLPRGPPSPHQPPRSHVLAVVRLCLAFLALVAGLVLGTTVIAAAGPPHRLAFGAAAVCYAIGLGLASIALRWRAAPDAPSVRRRILFRLAFAGLAEAWMLAALPWPPTRAEVGAFAPLAAALVLTVVAGVLAAQTSPLARWPLALLALWGLVVLGRFFWFFDRYTTGQGGPSFALSLLLVLTLSVTLVAAYVSGRPWWAGTRASTQRDMPPTT